MAAERFAAHIASLGASMVQARARAQIDGLWEGRPVETCRSIGCGYLARCHPEAARDEE
jgi:hypothetical protein